MPIFQFDARDPQPTHVFKVSPCYLGTHRMGGVTPWTAVCSLPPLLSSS